MQWPVVELAEWEELRAVPGLRPSLAGLWPDEVEGGMILCSPEPASARRLRDIDRAATLRAYCLARLEEHLGPLKERKLECRKVGCTRKRLDGSSYCVEHLIADRFGRHLAKLDPPAKSARYARARSDAGRAGQGTPQRKSPEPAATGSGLGNNSRRRPTLPQSFPCSTIGPGGLNFRVRDGIGCGPSGKTAGNLLPSDAMTANLLKTLFVS